MSDVFSTELADLPPELKSRLESLASTVRFDKIVVSFSIGGRDVEGRKKDTFYSAGVSKADGAGYTEIEAAIVHSMVSKHVLTCTYLDAARRGIISSSEAAGELRVLCQSYDDRIAKLLIKEASRG